MVKMNFKFLSIIIPFQLLITNVYGDRRDWWWKFSEEGMTRSPSFQSLAHVSGFKDDLHHECNRNCHGDKQIKKCYYRFKIEKHSVLSSDCYDCPFNLHDCLRPHCIVADGVKRTVLSINRRIPGPMIYVCENDEIIVDVVNEMRDETIIHWHGIHQIGTQYMDGAPFLTQCPIPSGNYFRYRFVADPSGTHFYHSHIDFQRAEGLYGALIARSRNDPHKHLYDVDDPHHVMLIMDWLDASSVDKQSSNHDDEFAARAYNILINGIGKFRPLQHGDKKAFAPLYEFRVKSGLRYRFRAISNGVAACPIEVSLQYHTLLVIASDGRNIEPVEVDSFVIHGGERYDFVVNANKRPGTYFFKYRGLALCGPRYRSAHQVAVLRYEGQKGFPNTPEEVNYDFTAPPKGSQLNVVRNSHGYLETFYAVADLRSYEERGGYWSYAGEPDHKFYLGLSSVERENTKKFFNFWEEEEVEPAPIFLVDNISLQLPNAPPLSQPHDVNQRLYCNSSSLTNCGREFCKCTHILNMKLGSLVELILVDTGTVEHPFHLHGYVFGVMGMEAIGNGTTVQKVQNLDWNGSLKRNFIDFPLKDTVAVPTGGYTIIRFIADNPGYWYFHCHINFHLETGMALIIHVGEQRDLPPVPPGFPRCGGSRAPSHPFDF